MDKKLVELRIDFLKQMDRYIFEHHEDTEEVWKKWLFSSCKNEIFKAIAENTGRWNSICAVFGKLTEED